MFEAVYITDTNNNLVFEYLTNLSSPNFVSLVNIIKLKQKDTSNDKDNDKLPLIEINNDLFICFQKTKNIIIYVLCSSTNNPNPIMTFVFINRLIEVMEDYFGVPLALTKIDANNDTLTLLLNEMIDDGIPNVTDFNKLRDLVPFKSLLSKLLSTSNELASAATNKSLQSLTHNTRRGDYPNDLVNSIPWRRSNVKYTNNEMYVDVTETINVILRPTSKNATSKKLLSSKSFDSAFYSSSSLRNSSRLAPIVGTIDGQINFNSHLTGVPLLQMILQIGGLNINVPSFHQCIKLDKWLENPGVVSFIPPDGKSTLMNYQIDLDLFNRKQQMEMLGIVEVDYQFGLGANQNEFEIKLFINTHKSVSKIDDLMIEINCETNYKNGDDEESTDSIANMKANRVTHGDFTFKGKGKGEWVLRHVSTGIQPIFHGSIMTGGFEDSSSEAFNEPIIKYNEPDLIEGFEKDKSRSPKANKPIKPIYLRLSYSHKGCIPSGLKVDSLKIISAKGLGDTVKPYKGVKYITRTGDFIIRS